VVTGSRFKTIAVTKRCSIKALVEEKSLKFKKGRGFYQLTKPEVIQDYKEVVIRRKSDGTIVTGDKVWEVLAIPKSSKKFKLDLAEISDFDVFVQSTSVNRILLAHTEFLYEVEDAEVATVGASIDASYRSDLRLSSMLLNISRARYTLATPTYIHSLGVGDLPGTSNWSSWVPVSSV